MTWSKLDKDRTSSGASEEAKARYEEIYGRPKKPIVWGKWKKSPPPKVEPPKAEITCEVRILTSAGTAYLSKDMIDDVQLKPANTTDLQKVEALTLKGKLFTEQDVTFHCLQLYMSLRSGEIKQIEYMLDDKLRGKFVRKGRGVQYWIANGRLHYYTIQEAT